jgi:catechol 2,3-dioxygenase-like lactoylglutathione lyase family enzyme
MPASETSLPPSFVTLTARDVPATIRWYRDLLGFTVVAERPGLNGRPVLAHLRRGPDQDLILVAGAEPTQIEGLGQGVTVTFIVDEDVEALAARATADGSVILDVPRTGLRRAREVVLLDPNGYRLVFAQRV